MEASADDSGARRVCSARVREGRSLVAVITGIFGIVMAAIGPVAGWLDYRGPGSASHADTRTRASEMASANKSSIKGFSIQYPPPEGTELVSQCTTARGTGSVASGQALVVAMQEKGDARIYFEGGVAWNQEKNRWSAELSLGDRSSVGN